MLHSIDDLRLLIGAMLVTHHIQYFHSLAVSGLATSALYEVG